MAVDLQAAFCEECGAQLGDHSEASASLETGSLDESGKPAPTHNERTNTIHTPQPPKIPGEVEEISRDIASTRPRRALIFVMAAVALALGAIVVFSGRWGKLQQTQVTTNTFVGVVSDARSGAISLLNPPVLPKVAKASFDPQNIRGTVIFESSGDGTKFHYPDGSQYLFSSKLLRSQRQAFDSS